ncbi:MAG: P22 coat - protein 5 family protein [Verrucomicrobiia bacterium]
MPNTLTSLIPAVVKGFDVVSRELVGFIPSVNRDPSADRLAKNQTLYSWAAPVASLNDIAPANVSPQAADKNLATKSISITNYKMTDFYFTGEEEKGLKFTDGVYGNIVTDIIEQAIRAIINQMESDVYTAAYVGSSRAYGTANTTPFGTNTGETAQLKKILDDNGAPLDTRSLILDTTTGAALRTLTQLTKVNEAGTSMTLRDGELLNLNKFMIKESAQITAPTAGTISGASTASGALTVGQVALPLKTAGTGLVVAGDIITLANDTNKYVVASTTSTVNPTAGEYITLNAPGIRKAQGAAERAITIVAASSRNVGFSRNAVLLATRLPARPQNDLARDVQVVTDSRSGISLELALYPQYRQVRYEISAAWGVTVIKPEHIVTLLGAA